MVGESTDSDYTDEPKLENYPELPQINCYKSKQNLINWIVKNIEDPTK